MVPWWRLFTCAHLVLTLLPITRGDAVSRMCVRNNILKRYIYIDALEKARFSPNVVEAGFLFGCQIYF